MAAGLAFNESRHQLPRSPRRLVTLILAMDLPEFQHGALGAPREWHDVLAIEDFAVGKMRRVECDGRDLFVHRAADGDWRIYDSRCPQQTTNIPTSHCTAA